MFNEVVVTYFKTLFLYLLEYIVWSPEHDRPNRYSKRNTNQSVNHYTTTFVTHYAPSNEVCKWVI